MHNIRNIINMIEYSSHSASSLNETDRDEVGRLKDDNISFTQDGAEVTATVSAGLSRSYTELGKKLQRIDELDEEIKTLKSQVKSMSKEKIADLFAATDAVNTRVVKTVSFSFTLSKNPKPTETVKYAKVIDELTQHLTPELIKVMEGLINQYKSTTQKEPSLRYSVNESLLTSITDKLARFKNFIFSWGRKYDQKLDSLINELRGNSSVISEQAELDTTDDKIKISIPNPEIYGLYPTTSDVEDEDIEVIVKFIIKGDLSEPLLGFEPRDVTIEEIEVFDEYNKNITGQLSRKTFDYVVEKIQDYISSVY